MEFKMKYTLVAQLEIAYLKDSKNNIIRKYFAPKTHFFYPGTWELEKMSNIFLKTMLLEELPFLKN